MIISPLPPALKAHLQNLGLMAPAMCFQNSLMAVMTTLEAGNLSYVLGWVTHPSDGKRTQHAWLKDEALYYDPTLEPQGQHLESKYEVVHELSTIEVTLVLKKRFGDDKVKRMMKGKEPWWCLCLLPNGNFGFVDTP